MYAVTAMVHHGGDDGPTRPIPHFYLDENVQGIVDEDHARRIARRVVDPFGVYAVTMMVVKV